MRHLGIAMALAVVSCGPERPGAGANLSASKQQIDAASPTAVLRFTAWDDSGAPAVGSVDWSTTGGALLEGAHTELVDGQAEVTFRCLSSADPGCSGPVRVGAKWNAIARSVNLSVAP